MAKETAGEQLVAAIRNAAGIILAVTENRNWIEAFLEGDRVIVTGVARNALCNRAACGICGRKMSG
jgi:hypothetical protein